MLLYGTIGYVPTQYPVQVEKEVAHLLEIWEPLSTVQAFELLDAQFAHRSIREYAVKCLAGLSDEDLAYYLLQLVQALKYESCHKSALAEFLLERAIANPVLIGHRFFWTLRAEMHITEISERYGLLIEEYLLGCGSHRAVLQKQNDALGAILEVAYYLKTVPKEDRLTQLRARLRKIELPDRFQLPLHPKFVAKGVVVEKCRYMDSAKLPLWCVFENADPNGAPLYTIVKAGDDLRQDLLCIQLLALMDRLWQREGLDLCMTPYGCVATGHDEGMLEIVLDADTTANISFEYGGAAAAFSKETISAWLKKHNPDETKYAAAVETFVRSAAGCRPVSCRDSSFSHAVLLGRCTPHCARRRVRDFGLIACQRPCGFPL